MINTNIYSLQLNHMRLLLLKFQIWK